MRTWKGTIAVEGEQTGDGRHIASNALYWDLAVAPVDLQWGVDTHDEYEVVGAVTSITRVGNDIVATGTLDDECECGTEIVRLMTLDPPLAGGVSMVLDDEAIEIVGAPLDDNLSDIIEETPDPPTVVVVSSAMTFGATGWTGGPAPAMAMLAAAGEPIPTDGSVLYRDARDNVIMNLIRGRIRAVTLVSTPAFSNAIIALDVLEPTGTAPAGTPAGDVSIEVEASIPAGESAPTDAEEMSPVTASAGPLAPPPTWFTFAEPTLGDTLLEAQSGIDGELVGYAVPLTITDDGRVFGHVAYWGACHVGYLEQCVQPPVSESSYRSFHVGVTVCDDGSSVPTGVLTMATDHPDLAMWPDRARDAYAHTGMAWADVRATNGEHGIWVTGALRPDITAVQLRVLRGSVLSGDWRRVTGLDGLQMIGVLAVNNPGFPIQRSLAAAAGVVVPDMARVVEHDDAGVSRMSGFNIARRCPTCGGRPVVASGSDVRLDAIERKVDVLMRRTLHLNAVAASALRDRIRR